MPAEITLSVVGRGKLTATASLDDGTILIRIDDSANPEFWAEVLVSATDLKRLLNSQETTYADQK